MNAISSRIYNLQLVSNNLPTLSQIGKMPGCHEVLSTMLSLVIICNFEKVITEYELELHAMFYCIIKFLVCPVSGVTSSIIHS